MIKYVTGGYGDSPITEVEITRETEHTVWFISSWNQKEERAAKHSRYLNYWQTWDEAMNYLLGKATARVVNYQRMLDEAQAVLDELNLMRKNHN